MRFVIVSGMSGAGKSTALKVLEDFGFFCVDNLPVALLPNFGEIASDRQTEVDKVAVGVDIRNGEQLTRLNSQLEVLWELGIEYELKDIAPPTQERIKNANLILGTEEI